MPDTDFAVSAADEPVEIDGRAAGEGQDDIFVEVGQVDVKRDVHAADVIIIDEAEIEAVHLLATGVDRLRGEEGDLSSQRTAGEIVAEGMRQVGAGVADGKLG